MCHGFFFFFFRVPLQQCAVHERGLAAMVIVCERGRPAIGEDSADVAGAPDWTSHRRTFTKKSRHRKRRRLLAQLIISHRLTVLEFSRFPPGPSGAVPTSGWPVKRPFQSSAALYRVRDRGRSGPWDSNLCICVGIILPQLMSLRIDDVFADFRTRLVGSFDFRCRAVP